jgi:enterochelin esterase-like enzyme
MKRWGFIAVAAMLLGATPAAAEPLFPPLKPGGMLVDCQTAAPGAPLCRLRHDLTETEARVRLAGKKQVFWVERDTFSVVAEDDREAVELCCAVQGPMARLPGTNLWTLSVRIPEMRRAILDVFIMQPGRPTFAAEWRGPEAGPPAIVADSLAGQIRRETVVSTRLLARRGLTIYLPPGWAPGGRYRVAYVADGQAVPAFAEVVEPLILAGRIEPVVLVGINAGDNAQRMRDYLVDFVAGDTSFARHEAFVIEEVMPLVEREFGASTSPKDRLLIGESNGGAWALDMALRHPELFGQAAPLSFGWQKAARELGKPMKPRLFFAAGTLEGNFLKRTTDVAQAARAEGYDVRLVTPVSGHSSFMWRDLYPQVFEWAYPRVEARRNDGGPTAGR